MSDGKFHVKQKRINLESKLPYLGVSRLEFERAIVIFKISNLEFIKNEFLTSIVNFSIGSVFSKAPGSTFSEGPVAGPGFLCKVYPMLLW